MIYHDEPVGGFTLQDDGNWLLFRVSDIAIMTAGWQRSRRRVLIPTKAWSDSTT
jgi:hypothetical protein